MTFDPEETVTLYNHGQTTLRIAVEQAMRLKLQDPQATIMRYCEPSILRRAQIEKLAADWGIV